jgi:hypothetical protein
VVHVRDDREIPDVGVRGHRFPSVYGCNLPLRAAYIDRVRCRGKGLVEGGQGGRDGRGGRVRM